MIARTSFVDRRRSPPDDFQALPAVGEKRDWWAAQLVHGEGDRDRLVVVAHDGSPSAPPPHSFRFSTWISETAWRSRRILRLFREFNSPARMKPTPK